MKILNLIKKQFMIISFLLIGVKSFGAYYPVFIPISNDDGFKISITYKGDTSYQVQNEFVSKEVYYKEKEKNKHYKKCIITWCLSFIIGFILFYISLGFELWIISTIIFIACIWQLVVYPILCLIIPSLYYI